MTRLATQRRRNPARSARGFTFVEIMIAMALGLFLIGGLLTLVQAMRRTSTNQSGLSQLQDNERMAMQLITDVVQSTGYFTNPVLNTAAGQFPAATYGPAVFTFAGQGIVGNVGAPDIITSRYQTAGTNVGDNVINCTGNASALPASFVNQITVVNNYLTCTLWVNGAQQPPVSLVPGITNMTVLYGVQTGNGAATNSADTYLDAAGVNAGPYWNVVKSVQVTLTFINPMFGQPGQTNATVNFTRTIDVMNRTGVIT
ncbi:MAG: PilW family protein [Steroidobacteraceae bacterium]|jgi:type IV pilus assembly protein PilW